MALAIGVSHLNLKPVIPKLVSYGEEMSGLASRWDGTGKRRGRRFAAGL